MIKTEKIKSAEKSNLNDDQDRKDQEKLQIITTRTMIKTEKIKNVEKSGNAMHKFTLIYMLVA